MGGELIQPCQNMHYEGALTVNEAWTARFSCTAIKL